MREEFITLATTTKRLCDEWPKVREKVLAVAEERVTRSRSSDLSSLLSRLQEDEFNEGKCQKVHFCQPVYNFSKFVC